jgi:glycosyltransferase involved in cell wall biosynthesis
MRIALVHDWFPFVRGGERVVSSLLDVFSDADIFTLFDFLSEKQKREFFRSTKFITSPLNRLPLVKNYYRHLFFLCPFFIEQFDVTGYDAVISSSAAFSRGVITRPDQPHMCYVHTPARYAWDQQFEYLRQAGLKYGLKGLLFRYLTSELRMWDFRTSFAPDVMVANSSYVRARIQRVYGRDSEVVFPPVALDEMIFREKKDDYYLVASFLVPYKRVDLIIRAFNEMPTRKLLVLGEGSELKKLKAMAKSNVSFCDYLPRREFLFAIANARAFVFAGCEDFGIVMAEAQACGTPVIAFNRGGARDIVRGLNSTSRPTGVLFGEQTSEAVRDAVERFESQPNGISGEACRENAMRFSMKRFHREILDAWSRTLEQKQRQMTVASESAELPVGELV